MFKLLGKDHIPQSIKKAVRLMLSYAIIVLLGAVWYAYTSDFAQPRELIRGLIRVCGVLALAWWLMSLAKNAWWLSLIMYSIFGIFGIVAISAFIYSGEYRMALPAIIPTYLLLHTSYILLSNETRQLFQSSDAA